MLTKPTLNCIQGNLVSQKNFKYILILYKCSFEEKNTKTWALGYPCGSAGKESACNVGHLDSIPGLGWSPGEGKGYPLLYSSLENSMDCIVHGVTESDMTEWLSLHFMCCFNLLFQLKVMSLDREGDMYREQLTTQMVLKNRSLFMVSKNGLLGRSDCISDPGLSQLMNPY